MNAVDLSDCVNGAEVGVIKRRRSTGLAIEPLQDFGAIFGPEVRDFQCHVAIHLRVKRLVDRTHPSPAEPFQDLEPVELLWQVRYRTASTPAAKSPQPNEAQVCVRSENVNPPQDQTRWSGDSSHPPGHDHFEMMVEPAGGLAKRAEQAGQSGLGQKTRTRLNDRKSRG